jgi:predicted site-specific integrase-resolvase
MAELINKKDAAKILGISIVTLDRLRKSGKLSYRKIGSFIKFTPGDIDEFIKKSVVNSKTGSEL